MQDLCKVVRFIAIAAFALLLPISPVYAADVPPPDVASYTIDVRYDVESRTLTAHETAIYVNRTEEPIPDLVFHLYLNAFRSGDTLWMQESGRSHWSSGYDPSYPGWIEVDQIALADGTPLTLEPVDDDETLVRAELPAPIAPGQSVTVALDFTAQLPRVFARTGWAKDGEFVMAGQWFPKFGVWEEGAWDAYPFHANSEFYADFGTYDVRVTLPVGWVIGATGISTGPPQAGSSDTEIHTFHAEHVIDFAWAASPCLQEMTRELEGGVHLRMLYAPDRKRDVKRVVNATEDAFDLYTTWYGAYGKGLYEQLTVVMTPQDASGAGGMEYPTMFTVGALSGGNMPACVRFLEVETVHELGHQWFQSVVATNEAEEPWLDEGFTDYSATRAMRLRYLYRGGVFDCMGWSLSYLGMRRLEYLAMPEVPMYGKAWDFGGITNYAIATYSKPAVALSTLERVVGEEAMLHFLQTYFDRYAFAHPTTADVRAVMAETLGYGTSDWFFDELVYEDGIMDAYVATLEKYEAQVERRGDLCLPNKVRITYRGGGGRQVVWLCETRDEDTRVFSGDEPITKVQIDPGGEILVDADRANNELSRRPDWRAWLGVVVRVIHMAQNFFFLGGAAW
jgi:hypothetical protein